LKIDLDEVLIREDDEFEEFEWFKTPMRKYRQS
jgi:hypothetical protein